MNLFTAEWCGPCKMLKKWLADNNLTDKVTIIDVDSEDGQGLAQKSGVRGLPALETENGIITSNENIRPFLMELNDA